MKTREKREKIHVKRNEPELIEFFTPVDCFIETVNSRLTPTAD